MQKQREMKFEKATLVMWFGLAVLAIGFFGWLANRTGASGTSLFWIAVMAVGIAIAVGGRMLRHRIIPPTQE